MFVIKHSELAIRKSTSMMVMVIMMMQVMNIMLSLFYSILGCVLPLQEVALCHSPPNFSVLCCPCPYRSLLPHNVISSTTFWSSNWSYTLYLPLCTSNSLLPFIWAMCPAHFHFILVMYWTVCLCQMMVLQILSFSLTLSIFLSMAC